MAHEEKGVPVAWYEQAGSRNVQDIQAVEYLFVLHRRHHLLLALVGQAGEGVLAVVLHAHVGHLHYDLIMVPNRERRLCVAREGN